MFSQFRGLGKVLRRYLRHYGGWRAVFCSPLFLAAFVVTGLDYNSWINVEWVDLSKSLVPSLLGFSLGTYAILFSLLTGRLKQALQQLEISPGISMLAMVNATFFHFIVVQIAALVWAFVYGGTLLTDLAYLAKGVWPAVTNVAGTIAIVGSFIGHLLLVYSFMLILGAALAIYRLAGIREPESPENRPQEAKK